MPERRLYDRDPCELALAGLHDDRCPRRDEESLVGDHLTVEPQAPLRDQPHEAREVGRRLQAELQAQFGRQATMLRPV